MAGGGDSPVRAPPTYDELRALAKHKPAISVTSKQVSFQPMSAGRRAQAAGVRRSVGFAVPDSSRTPKSSVASAGSMASSSLSDVRPTTSGVDSDDDGADIGDNVTLLRRNPLQSAMRQLRIVEDPMSASGRYSGSGDAAELTATSPESDDDDIDAAMRCRLLSPSGGGASVVVAADSATIVVSPPLTAATAALQQSSAALGTKRTIRRSSEPKVASGGGNPTV